MNYFPEAEVYEIKKIKLNSPIILAGFVGAGLAGTISLGYIIEKLKMKEIGYMRSKYLPPATVFIQGRLRHPFRFYSNKGGTICAIICEITLQFEGLYSIASAILDWSEKNGSDEIVVLDGVPSKEAHDQKAFCAAEEDLCRIMADSGINMIPQGFVTGIPGAILNECILRKIRGVTLLVKADPQKPDPLAAATLVEAVNRVYQTGIDTKELREQEKQLGVDLKAFSDKYTEARKAETNLYM
ncbi:MAG TPA: PAC2 family protein [Nitrosopumilaceae archaeon]|nr:PAC2 family protein [Nitrosopumilaceae archaeon]